MGEVKELMVVMPTSAGKSVMFLPPLLVESLNHLCVVIIPMRALVVDITKRCKRANIDFLVWSSGEALLELGAAVVLVSTDLAPSTAFRSAVLRFVLKGLQYYMWPQLLHSKRTSTSISGYFRASPTVSLYCGRSVAVDRITAFVSSTELESFKSPGFP